jgi:hypothetical protein
LARSRLARFAYATLAASLDIVAICLSLIVTHPVTGLSRGSWRRARETAGMDPVEADREFRALVVLSFPVALAIGLAASLLILVGVLVVWIYLDAL